MRFSRVLLLLLVPALLTLGACKDDSPSGPGSDKKSILTAKPWKTTLFTIEGADARSLHWETTTFKADGTVTGVQADGDTDSGTWEFNTDETQLIVKDLGPGYNWTILELTGSSLKVKDDNEESGAYALKLVWHAIPQ